MTRLELIMNDTTNTPDALDDDALDALLADAADGTLTPQDQQRLERALALAPHKRAELAFAQQARDVVKTLPHTDTPDDMMARVRARLAQQHSNNIEVETLPPWRMSSWMLGAGLAVAASLLIFVSVPHGGGSQVDAAGVAQEAVVTSTLHVEGLEDARVAALALASGMYGDASGYTGDSKAARRFVFALREAAGAQGHDVTGLVVEGATMRIVVGTH
jgi:anti-sigma factor RsiW